MGVFEIFERRRQAQLRGDPAESEPLLEGGGGSANSSVPEEYVEKRKFLCCCTYKAGFIFFGLFLVFFTIIEMYECYVIA